MRVFKSGNFVLFELNLTKIVVILLTPRIHTILNECSMQYDCRGFVDEPFNEHREKRSGAGVLLHFLFSSRFNRPIAISPPWSFLINHTEPKPES